MHPEMFDPPRWNNGPKICAAANLPAFETEKEMKKFQDTNGSDGVVILTWQCTKCALWHYWRQGGSNSSGTGVGQRHKIENLEALLKSRIKKTFPADVIAKAQEQIAKANEHQNH